MKDVEEISKDKSTSLRKLFACDEDTIKMEFVIYGWENWLVKLYVLSDRSAF